jgi:hypothetical protein
MAMGIAFSIANELGPVALCHCERSEAISNGIKRLLRRSAPRKDTTILLRLYQ